jgi:HK97 family phage portal protein
MGLFDFFKNTKQVNQAITDENLPLPLRMRQQGYLTGIGGNDLYAMLSRRLPSSSRDWSVVAGDLMLNSIVAIAMDYYVKAFSQAVPMVYQKNIDGAYEKNENHPILDLISNPNFQLSPTRFWSNIIIDYKLYGNAYIRKIRNSKTKEVIALQFLPSQQVKPIGDDTNALVQWNYVVDGRQFAVELDDIIHIAYGRDPVDFRLGRSPLSSTLREIATDNQASSTAYGLMANAGLPSIMVSPDVKDDVVDVSDDDLRTMKKRLTDSFVGDNAGSIAVMSGPFKLERVSFSPNDMALDAIRHTPEERISSALGLNCLVLNLSAGLENSTYANLKEAEQSAWNQGVIPLLRTLAESITQNLMYEFSESKKGDYFDWDLGKITALMDDVDDLAKRISELYISGIIDRAEARRMLGIGTNPTDEQVFHPDSMPTPILTENPNIEPQKNIKALPTEKMKEEAKRGLAWREEFGRGGSNPGFARAKQIIAGEPISDSDVKQIFAFFSRHEIDKKAEGFNIGEEGYPSNGRIAWSLWGGDAGFEWAKKERAKIQ